MCKPRLGHATRWMVILAIPAIVAKPAEAGAQSTTDARNALDSLLPQWHAASLRATEAEAERRRVARTVSIQRGHLRILADADIAERVAAAAAVASTSLDRVFGDEARRLADHTVVVQENPARKGQTARGIRVRWSAEALHRRENGPLGFPRDMEHLVTGDANAQGQARLVHALEAVGAAPLHALLDEEMRLWFRSALSATPESPEELVDIYVDLTTASTRISRRCLDGDLSGCRQVLGLTPVTDVVLDAFTATQRRALVGGNIELLRTPAKAAEFDRCVGGMDDAACVSRLRDLSVERLSRSISTTTARRSFARWALATGGKGAYTRLRDASGRAIEDRFAVAAGMTGDELVASWRAHVMTAQPASSNIPPATAFATLLWIGACGALSLRSSRWR